MNFLKNITIGQYIPADSFIHKLDPRTKILIVGLIIVQCFVINKWQFLVLPFLAVSICCFFAAIPWKFIFRGLKPVLPFVLITFVFNSFLTIGTPVISYKFPAKVIIGTGAPGEKIIHYKFSVKKEGLEMGTLMGMRLLLIVLATSLFTLTTSSIEITDGIESLMAWGRCIKLPVHEIAMMMSIALRFIPTLLEHLEKIIKAQVSRGAGFEDKSIMKRAKSYIPVLIPLFVQAFRTADDLATAMEARGYHGGDGRSRLKTLKMHWQDTAVLTAVFCFCIAVTLNYFGVI